MAGIVVPEPDIGVKDIPLGTVVVSQTAFEPAILNVRLIGAVASPAQIVCSNGGLVI